MLLLAEIPQIKHIQKLTNTFSYLSIQFLFKQLLMGSRKREADHPRFAFPFLLFPKCISIFLIGIEVNGEQLYNNHTFTLIWQKSATDYDSAALVSIFKEVLFEISFIGFTPFLLFKNNNIRIVLFSIILAKL